MRQPEAEGSWARFEGWFLVAWVTGWQVNTCGEVTHQGYQHAPTFEAYLEWLAAPCVHSMESTRLQADDGNSDMPWKIIKCLSRGPSAITEGRRWVEHDKIFWGRETTFREFYYTLSLQLLCCVMVDSYLLLCRLWAATHHGYIHVRETMIYQEYYL